jgi:hypothetical protein
VAGVLVLGQRGVGSIMITISLLISSTRLSKMVLDNDAVQNA